MSVLTRLLDSNEAELRRLRKVVGRVNEFESEFVKRSDEDLAQSTARLRERLGKGEPPDDVLPEVFAAVREAAKRTLGQRHFDVQLMGGVALHKGHIAEMKTGEGKTLVASLALYMNALEGKGAHLVTTNDYLAKTGAGWMAPIYHALGASVAYIAHEKSAIYDPAVELEAVDPRHRHWRDITRREAYLADITYGQNSEFGFDYLRDNMAVDLAQCVQRGLNFAIVDEVDSILIDEARTPLIISGQGQESTEKYYQYARLIPRLTADDYTVDEKTKSAALTEEGIAKIERWTGIKNVYELEHVDEAHQINQALKAYTLFHRDRDYLVKDGEVIIVDEFTGRQQPGRRWSDGLHQAVEAKEGVKVQQETQTLATITYQNYFRLYTKLAGMTGTAVTEAEEFDKIYKLQVVVIPTHKPMIRDDNADLIYKTEDAKFKAVADEIQDVASKGRPVLVGTVSVEKSERLARLLEKRGVAHEVLNAKQHEREALIVANAGQPGAVTIATNMAGRGTDIVLGPGVADGGGLHIVGTERHESRRIDNQLRGRAGRQGDPGSSRFFLALDDDLMRIFGGERIKGMMNMLRVADDEPIESRLVSRQIEGAQTKVEGHNFDARRYLVEYDDVMNKQREIIYGERRKVLEGADLREQVQDWIRKAVDDAVNEHCESRHPDNWDLEGLVAQLGVIFPLPPFSELAADEFGETKEAAAERLMEYADAAYKAKEAEMTEPMMRKIEQFVVLKTIDSKWISYLTEMEHFKEGIGLRAFGQKDPLVEYKNEAFQAFQELLNGIQFDIASTVFRVQLVKEPPTPTPPAALATARGRQGGAATATAASPNGGEGNTAPVGAGKLGRNDPCWCGSGKKYKKCHGR